MEAMVEALRRPFATVGPGATVADVARIMLSIDARAVVVSQRGRLVGILTERDVIARVVARELPLSTPVEAVMTSDPVTLPASASAREAYSALRDHQVRQLPLVVEDRVVGLLVRDDLISELMGDPFADVPEGTDGLAQVLDLYRHCPHCGADHLRAVEDGRSANLLCMKCRQCWHPDHGSLLRVDPDTCPGCPDRRFCRFPLVGC